MSISEQTADELFHAAKLDSKQRGELAELAFMRKAATMGFAVAKPWGDSDRYDVIVRSGKIFWRVQVKSVWGIAPSRNHYRVRSSSRFDVMYTAEEIDFLVAYVFPEDSWYVFPVSIIENRKILCLPLKNRRSQFAKYREAWELMRPVELETANGEITVADAGSAVRS